MNKKGVGLIALVLLCTTLWAQQKDSIQIQQLDEVVVTDSRFDLKRENSGKTVIKITEEELKRNQGRSVAELINTKTGFELNGSRSNAGQNISSFVRGGNNRQILVLIDGIQVSDPSNVNAEFDLRLLNLNQIESIEILKGAASTLYGNSAATAVINITTKSPKNEGLNVNLSSSFGTNQSQEDQNYRLVDFANSASISFKKEKLSVSGAFGNQNTNGLSAAIGEESDEFNRNNINLKLGYQFSNSFQTNLGFYFDELRNDFDNGFPVEDADFSAKSEQLRYVLNSEYNYGTGSLNFNASINTIDRKFESNFPSEFDSESAVIDIFNKYVIAKKWHTILGVNLISSKTVFDVEEKSTTTDPYVNVVYVSDFGFNLNLGGRLNSHSEYGTNLVYNFNPSYSFKVAEGYFKLFGSYATSFIAPNLSQLFGPFGPNPDLEPEENTTFEGGFEFRPHSKLRFSALYFDRTEENGIDFVVINPETFESQYQNSIPKRNFYGLEFEFQGQISNTLQLSANYSLTKTAQGLALRIPENKWNAQLDYQINEKWSASANFQSVSSRNDIDFATFENVELDAFSLFGLYSKYTVNNSFSIFVNVENLFNEEYAEIVNFTTRGRNIRLGFNWNL